jgi:hypothetical protein
MYASVRALLAQIVDYAGLFPPAKLPLEAALTNYLRERKESPQRWMLGRFVCPASRLAELMSLAKRHPDAELLTVAALGQQAASASEVLPTLQTDLEAIESFRAGWEREDVIDVYEAALPKGTNIAQLQSQLPHVPGALGEAKLAGFLEVPITTRRDDIARLADTLHELQHTQPIGTLGMKLRCGGLMAEAFPGDADVAWFIDRTRRVRVPFKATAGLHHPRRHYDAALKVWHHGFLNVFTAGILSRTNSLTEADLVTILSDHELLSLRFEEDRLTWGNWSCSAAQIAEARTTGATTFGSCSFEEPCQDLIAMNLIP